MKKLKLYWFDDVLLTFKRHTKAEVFLALFTIVFIFLVYSYIDNLFTPVVERVSEKQQLIIIDEYKKFTPEKLVKLIKDLNILQPHIVYAQAYQECTYEEKRFNSYKFWNNHNLFGMKEAQRKPTTAIGTERDAAVYKDWQDCVIDYALWQAMFSNRAKDEETYFSILQQVYAEDTSYVKNLKILIRTEKLEELFK